MELPELEKVGRILLQEGEVYIAAGGFEERVFAFPRVLEVAGGTGAAAVLLRYLPTHKGNRLEELRKALSSRELRVCTISYNRYGPHSFDGDLRARLIDLGATAVCLDVSAMSRLAIMLAVDVVRELNLPLRVVYAESHDYAPTREEFEEAKNAGEQHLPTSFIHTGVYDVVHVPCLSSVQMQNRATLLVAFDSFNEALCQAMVNVINPSRFILVNGRPPREELRWREGATAYVHHLLREEWSIENDNEPMKTTSTLRYEETYRLLADVYWKFSADHRIVLAPTGSKMQTLGAYLLRAAHEDVHIEYPTVEGFFAEKYSTGVRQKWEVRFGAMNDFVTRLFLGEREDHLGLPREVMDTEID